MFWGKFNAYFCLFVCGLHPASVQRHRRTSDPGMSTPANMLVSAWMQAIQYPSGRKPLHFLSSPVPWSWACGPISFKTGIGGTDFFHALPESRPFPLHRKCWAGAGNAIGLNGAVKKRGFLIFSWILEGPETQVWIINYKLVIWLMIVYISS